MVTILYSGPPLDTATVLQMAHDAAGGHPETRLELRQCCTREQLAQALEEAAGQVGRGEERYFSFNAVEGTCFLTLSQVLYFKGRGHRVVAALTDGRELVSRTLRVSISRLLKPLTDADRFYQAHRSVFINKAHIAVLGRDSVTLDNGTVLPASRGKSRAFHRELREAK